MIISPPRRAPCRYNEIVSARTAALESPAERRPLIASARRADAHLLISGRVADRTVPPSRDRRTGRSSDPGQSRDRWTGRSFRPRPVSGPAGVSRTRSRSSGTTAPPDSTPGGPPARDASPPSLRQHTHGARQQPSHLSPSHSVRQRPSRRPSAAVTPVISSVTPVTSSVTHCSQCHSSCQHIICQNSSRRGEFKSSPAPAPVKPPATLSRPSPREATSHTVPPQPREATSHTVPTRPAPSRLPATAVKHGGAAAVQAHYLNRLPHRALDVTAPTDRWAGLRPSIVTRADRSGGRLRL